MGDKRCNVCGRVEFNPPDYAQLPQPGQCWVAARLNHPTHALECYRLGYSRSQEALAAANARADAAVAEIVNEQRRFGEMQREAWKLEEAIAAARRECEAIRNDIAAWMLDRADQYETDDPIWVGIADLAKGVVRGDAQTAAQHGELDADLYSRLGITFAAPAAGEEGK